MNDIKLSSPVNSNRKPRPFHAVSQGVNNENIMRGVQNRQISREEFLDLSADQTAIADLYTHDNFSNDKELQQMVALRQRALAQKVVRYTNGSHSPTVGNPQGDIATAQRRHANQIFDGLSEGSISRQEGQMNLTGNQLLSANARNSKDGGAFHIKAQASFIRQSRAENEFNATASSLSLVNRPPGLFGFGGF